MEEERVQEEGINEEEEEEEEACQAILGYPKEGEGVFKGEES